MTRIGGKACGKPQGIVRHIRHIKQAGLAERQCAGLVEEHGIGLGKPLHCRAILDHDPVLEQFPRCNNLYDGNSKTQCTRAGDDQNGNCNQHRLFPVSAKYAPGNEGYERQEVNHRRIVLRSAICQAPITRPAPFGRFHQANDLRQEGLTRKRRCPDGQWTGEVQGTRLNTLAWLDNAGGALTVDDGHVQVAGARYDHAIHRHPFARCNKDGISRNQLGNCPVFALSTVEENHGTAR